MKEIQLTQGKVAFVDDADYEWLNQWKWFAKWDGWNWYARRSVLLDGKSSTLDMHVVILNTPKGMQSDHKDGDGLNNQHNNLRICTRAENQHNQTTQTRNKSSKFKGVTWRKDEERWQAQIKYKSHLIQLGRFKSEIDAVKAYDMAAKKYHGEFARLNLS